MAQATIIIGSTKKAPKTLSRSAAKVWDSATKVTVVGPEAGIPWSRLGSQLSRGDVLGVENILLLSQEKDGQGVWYNTWHRVEQLLEKGVVIMLLEEEVVVRNQNEETYRALKAVARQVYAKTEQKAKRRNETVKRSASGGVNIGWVVPTEEDLRHAQAVIDDSKNIAQACRTLGVSRATLYSWRSKGMVNW